MKIKILRSYFSMNSPVPGVQNPWYISVLAPGDERNPYGKYHYLGKDLEWNFSCKNCWYRSREEAREVLKQWKKKVLTATSY